MSVLSRINQVSPTPGSVMSSSPSWGSVRSLFLYSRISQVSPPLLQDQSGQPTPTPGSDRSLLHYSRISQESSSRLHDRLGQSNPTPGSDRSVLPYSRIRQVAPPLLQYQPGQSFPTPRAARSVQPFPRRPGSYSPTLFPGSFRSVLLFCRIGQVSHVHQSQLVHPCSLYQPGISSVIPGSASWILFYISKHTQAKWEARHLPFWIKRQTPMLAFVFKFRGPIHIPWLGV